MGEKAAKPREYTREMNHFCVIVHVCDVGGLNRGFRMTLCSFFNSRDNDGSIIEILLCKYSIYPNKLINVSKADNYLLIFRTRLNI